MSSNIGCDADGLDEAGSFEARADGADAATEGMDGSNDVDAKGGPRVGLAGDSLPESPLDDALPTAIEDVAPEILAGLTYIGSLDAHGYSEVAENHHEVTPEMNEAVLANALNDSIWYAPDGERYSALLVMENGDAYGRPAEADDYPLPSEADNYGASDLPEFGDWFFSESAVEEAILLMEAQNAHPSGGQSGDIQHPSPDPLPILCGDVACDRRKLIDQLGVLTAWPRRTVGALTDSANVFYSARCTGAKVGPRAVLTNAHCVLDREGEWTTSGYFQPGRRYGELPNAGGTAVPWSGVFAKDWRVHRKYDYAVIFLQDRESAVDLGWFGIQWWTDADSYSGKETFLTGYPASELLCKESPFPTLECSGYMYEDHDVLEAADYRSGGLDDEQLAHDTDSQGGMSGSPLWRASHQAILAVNWGSWGEPDRYFGVRFRRSMYNDVCSWIAAVPSAHGSHANCN